MHECEKVLEHFMSLVPPVQEATISEYSNHSTKSVVFSPIRWPGWSLPSWTASYSQHLDCRPTRPQECDSDSATGEGNLAQSLSHSEASKPSCQQSLTE